jgi:hypothetical protein
VNSEKLLGMGYELGAPFLFHREEFEIKRNFQFVANSNRASPNESFSVIHARKCYARQLEFIYNQFICYTAGNSIYLLHEAMNAS